MAAKVVAFLAVLALGTVAMGDIVGTPVAADDGDGVIVCSSAWNGGTYELTITGDHYRHPEEGITGHVSGSFATDTELDPTVGMITYIDNDTDFAWTGYHINVYMDKTFQIGLPTVLGPPGWTTARVQPAETPGTFYDDHGRAYAYVGRIDLYAGTPVPIGNTLSFMYTLSFLGGVSYGLEMTPTPEPATVGLLALGGLALIRRRQGAARR